MKPSTLVSNGGKNGIVVKDGATSSTSKRGGPTVENGHGCHGGEQSLQEACDGAGLPAAQGNPELATLSIQKICYIFTCKLISKYDILWHREMIIREDETDRNTYLINFWT